MLAHHCKAGLRLQNTSPAGDLYKPLPVPHYTSSGDSGFAAKKPSASDLIYLALVSKN